MSLALPALVCRGFAKRGDSRPGIVAGPVPAGIVAHDRRWPTPERRMVTLAVAGPLRARPHRTEFR